jgi:hypothetical protein
MIGKSPGCVKTRFGEIGNVAGKSGTRVSTLKGSSDVAMSCGNWSNRLMSVGSLLQAKDHIRPNACRFGIRLGLAARPCSGDSEGPSEGLDG